MNHNLYQRFTIDGFLSYHSSIEVGTRFYVANTLAVRMENNIFRFQLVTAENTRTFAFLRAKAPKGISIIS